MASLNSSLFYGAAALNLLIIPKHLYVGATNVSSAIKTIPEENPGIKRGKEVVGTTWDLVNGSLAIVALLNYYWARTSGPSSWEEKMVILASALSGWYAGAQYYKIGMYVPLSVLWLAPTASLLAWLW